MMYSGGQTTTMLRPSTVVIVDTDGEPIKITFGLANTLVYLTPILSDFTGVACYTGAGCGNDPVHLPTSMDCCLQNILALTSYRTPDDPDTCKICLGKFL